MSMKWPVHGRPLLRTALVVAGLALLLQACGSDTESRLAEVRSLQDAGAYQETLGTLRDILAKDPENAEANYRLGMALLGTGRTTEALFALKKASESNELAVQAGVVLASTLHRLSNDEGAIDAAEAVLRRDPENQAALLTRAQAALAAKKGEVALDSADRLLALRPEGPLARVLHAQALGHIKGRYEEARAELEKLEKADWSQWGDAKGGPARMCLALAELYQKSFDDHDRAAKQLETCVDRYADEPAVAVEAARRLEEMERDSEATTLLRAALERHPDDPALRAHLAERLIAEDDFDEAEALMLAAVKEHATPATWVAVSQVRRKSVRTREALEAIDQALALQPKEADLIHLQRADLLAVLGRLDEAEAEEAKIHADLYRKVVQGEVALERGHPAQALHIFDGILQRWPNNAGLRMLAARAANQLGQEERALAELKEATRHEPKDTDAALYMAQLYLARGEPRLARSFAWRHIEKRGTPSPHAHLVAARAALALGRPDLAVRDLEDLRERRDGLFAGAALAEIGQIQLRQMPPAKALAAYRAAVKKAGLDLSAGANELALRQLVNLELEAGQADRALQELDARIQAHPQVAVLHALRGHVLRRTGRGEEARASYARALELDPDQAFALAGEALLDQAEGDLGGATQKLDRAASLVPDVPDYAYLAAKAVLAGGDTAGARTRLDRLLRDHPGHAWAANDLAWLLAESGQELERAESLAQRAVRLDPDPEIWDTLGWVQLKRGRADAAVSSFQKALARRSDFLTARFHLGLAQARRGDRQAAVEAFQAALDGGPFPEADQARVRLAGLQAPPEATH